LYRFPVARRQREQPRSQADLACVVQVALEPTHVSVWLGQ